MIITAGLSISLQNAMILTSDNPLFFVLLFGGLIAGFIFFFYYKPKLTTIELNNDLISINDLKYRWSDIKSYQIRDDSPEFTIVRIKTDDNKTINLGHRNKSKDDYFRFVIAFEQKIITWNKNNDKKIRIIPLIWDTKAGKVIGFVMIGVWISLMTFSLLIGFNTKLIANMLIFTGITVPLLIRIFVKKK
ncbi:MAG: hypothetical protein ACOCWM_04760 [Cyclobacteriaceae bacterium]